MQTGVCLHKQTLEVVVFIWCTFILHWCPSGLWPCNTFIHFIHKWVPELKQGQTHHQVCWWLCLYLWLLWLMTRTLIMRSCECSFLAINVLKTKEMLFDFTKIPFSFYLDSGVYLRSYLHDVTCVPLTCMMNRQEWSGWSTELLFSLSSAISWPAAWRRSIHRRSPSEGRSAVCESRHKTLRPAERWRSRRPDERG